MKRRDFLKGTLASGVLLACASDRLTGAVRGAGGAAGQGPASFSDPKLEELANLALQAARDAGASYADVRIADYRRQALATREDRVTSIRDSEDSGFGVRVISKGTWGFAASGVINREEVVRVARRAVALANTNSVLQREPVQLVPTAVHRAVWNSPLRRDPFQVSLEEKIDLLLRINAEALRVPGVSFCSSGMNFTREHKFFASSEGSYIEQTLHRCAPDFTVTSVDNKLGSFQTRNSFSEPQGRGYEYVEEYPWFDDVRLAGAEAVAKHTAKQIEPGKKDLVLHPTNLWLTIHESIGHPTELDRALGMEANYAGTSFLDLAKLGKFKIASDIVNFNGEKTHEGALATCGYDDEGVQTTEWPIVKDGLFVDYQTTRDQAALIGRTSSHGSSYAQSWQDVAFQRMPNVNLLPGKQKLSLSDLIASTDDGIFAKGRASYSIDHQRYNFQFSAQTFYEIKGGKLGAMLNDVAYQARTPDFWNACDAICSEEEYQVGGSANDGKGEPGQSNAVSHGCPPARFRQINVLNTKRSV